MNVEHQKSNYNRKRRVKMHAKCLQVALNFSLESDAEKTMRTYNYKEYTTLGK